MKKSVLNVVSVYFSIPFFFGDQLLYFNNLGYDMHIICSPSDKLQKYSELKKFKFKEVKILRRISPIKDILAVIKIINYIKKNNIDIVSGHTAKGGLLSMIAAFLARTPKRIYFRHGFYYENSTGIKKFLMKNLDKFTALLSTKVVTVSPFVYEKSIELKLNKTSKLEILNIGSCNGVDAENKFNPININLNKKNEIINLIGLKNDDFVIGYTGRLVKDKGIVELVDAFIELNKKYNNVKLLLVGPEEIRNAIPENTMHAVKNNKNIIVTGLIESDIEYYYSMMSILALPTHREGFGTSILEASSMQKPVLTTSHTGSRDAIINGKTGQYIKNSPEDILIKMENYLLNPKLQKTHGEQGRNHMLKNFSQILIWKEIKDNLYENNNC